MGDGNAFCSKAFPISFPHKREITSVAAPPPLQLQRSNCLSWGLDVKGSFSTLSLKEVCPESVSQVVTKLGESKESKPGWGQMCWGPYHTSSSSQLEGDSQTSYPFPLLCISIRQAPNTRNPILCRPEDFEAICSVHRSREN